MRGPVILTQRQAEIVALYETANPSYREVGEKLGISPHTVKVHINHIVQRLDTTLPAKMALISYARRDTD